jgi:DNA-binding response OmpR family regulator
MFGFKKKKPVFVLAALDASAVLTSEIVLDRDQTLIGRDDEAHVVLAGSLASRAHAVIYRSGAQFTLEDAGSRNGTYVNGVPISGAHDLDDGDEIGFGHATPDAMFRDKSRTAVAKADLRYDARQNIFFYGDKQVGTVGEQTVFLKFLFDNRGRLCDRQREWDKFRDDDALDKMCSRVRNALRAASPAAASLLVTHRGVGYELRSAG